MSSFSITLSKHAQSSGVRMCRISEKAAPAALLVRAAQGDEAAFKGLFEAHKARVYSLCLAIARTPAGAEDLTVHTFTKVFSQIGTIRDETEFLRLIDDWSVRLSIRYRRDHRLDEVALGGRSRGECI